MPVYGPKQETQAAYWVRIKRESMEQHPIYDQDKINALLAAGVLEHHERRQMKSISQVDKIPDELDLQSFKKSKDNTAKRKQIAADLLGLTSIT